MNDVFTYAGYSKDIIEQGAVLTTLDFLGCEGSYNVFRTSYGEIVVAFSDHPKLTNLITRNPGALFLVRHVILDTKITEYDVQHVVGTSSPVIARTIGACALLLASPPKGLRYTISVYDGKVTVVPAHVK